MNRVICAQGHYYDGDRYESCPHCAEGTPAIVPDHFAVVKGGTQHEEKKEEKHRGFFGKRNNHETKEPVIQDDRKTERLSPDEMLESYTGKGGEKSEDFRYSTLTQEEQRALSERKNEGEQFYKPNVDSSSSQGEPENSGMVEQAYSFKEERAIGSTLPTPETSYSVPSTGSSLQSALVQAADAKKRSMDEGKTVGYFSGASEPPVGYLVCTKGEDFGRGFLLKSGNNTIGRSQAMDVVVMDPKVSREKQAYVMYEPRKREFYVRPGEGSGLCYYNDELIMAPTKLQPYDKIGVGDTELMLIAVCGERFSWDEV